jgi:CRP-like cAMP-binding protein
MAPKTTRPFDAKLFLESAGLGKRIVAYARKEVVFSQGDPCDHVLYVQSGAIRLPVLSHSRKSAVVAVVGPGEFLGEGALAGHLIRLETATATTASTVLLLPKRQMIRLLHSQHTFSDGSSRTCRAGTHASRQTLWITCSTRAKNDWPARCSCWRATARKPTPAAVAENIARKIHD